MSVGSELHKIWKTVSDPGFRARRREVKAFRAAHGRGTPERYTGLTPGAVALDIGGYRGDWAERMASLYGLRVEIFEPHPRFAAAIAERFAGRDDIRTHAFAIGSQAGSLALSDDENASSALVGAANAVQGKVRPVDEVFEALGLSHVAVAKMNIEGGEYDLLPALIDSGLIGRIDRLTVQFHDYGSGQSAARDRIREGLARTHTCAWEYPFIWEEWERLPR
jgi:FkbM family methyltransferase